MPVGHPPGMCVLRPAALKSPTKTEAENGSLEDSLTFRESFGDAFLLILMLSKEWQRKRKEGIYNYE